MTKELSHNIPTKPFLELQIPKSHTVRTTVKPVALTFPVLNRSRICHSSTMPSSKSKDSLVFVHHKKTGEIEVRRAGEFSKRPKTPSTPLPRHLHYTNRGRLHVCRCVDPKRHGDASTVASDSTHLAADLTRFLDLHHLDACSMAEYRAYEENQKAEWTQEGVCIEDFHYATKQKDVVCRCSAPNNHGRGPVRNPDIAELCAEFFRLKQGKMTCTKAQWRAVGDPPAVSNRQSFDNGSRSMQDFPPRYEQFDINTPLPTPRPDMTYLRDDLNDRPDIPEQVWANARPSIYTIRSGSATSSSTPIGTAVTPHFPVADDARTIRGSRPPMLKVSPRTSTATTWTAIQREAAGEPVKVSPKSLRHPPSSPHVTPSLGITNLQDGIADVEGRIGKLSHNPWNSGKSTPQTVHTPSPSVSSSSFAPGSSVSVPPPTPKHELPATPMVDRPASKSATASTIIDPNAWDAPITIERDVCQTPAAGPTRRSSGKPSVRRPSIEREPVVDRSAWDSPIDRLAPQSPVELPTRRTTATPVARQLPAELATRTTPIEFPAIEPLRRMTSHSATLRYLEDKESRASASRPGTRSSIRVEDTNSRMSQSTQASLSSMFRQAFDAVNLPDQEEYLLRHVVVCSRANPAPIGNCTLCNGPFDDHRARTLQLPACGHFLHEQCLVADFRIRDQAIGACPICDLALCERGLADRIDTDREAIFGSQFTKLRNEVRIEFQQRGEAARLQSEEELAAAQLRLLKDYIDMHAEELWRRWDVRRAEPDWYTGVICPVVKLFKGWSLPSQQSRYFADRDAFIKFVAWAELVRLMNVTRATMSTVPDELPDFPPLAELHRKFIWAKNRYDKEKVTWKTNHRGILDCEKVALDAYNVAISTHSTQSEAP